jgi:hypothetical protein
MKYCIESCGVQYLWHHAVFVVQAIMPYCATGRLPPPPHPLSMPVQCTVYTVWWKIIEKTSIISISMNRRGYIDKLIRAN